MLKELIKLQIAEPSWFSQMRKMEKDDKRHIFLIGTPVHGNLGDHAIAYEELNFLNTYFSSYHIYEILMPMYHTQKKWLKEIIKPFDIIFISGGGWMGNLWLHNEIIIREIIDGYQNNQIVIFPQTLFYTDDEDGRRELETTKRIFSKHRNLTFLVRENKSYNLVTGNFEFLGNSKVMLFPDMVLYGSFPPSVVAKNENIINICLRNDCEGVQEVNKKNLILPSGYLGIEISTVKNYRISLHKRTYELRQSWNQFAEAGLTITDRLHAMLFSVINGTPCIAINNKTGKVFGVAKWIEDTNMVLFASNKEEAVEKIPESLEMKKKPYEPGMLKEHFEEMASMIKEGIK